ncbi:MAG: DUF1569 domain-containing protein [Leptospirales bacterium]|nr:DUF1569 domain-containing protein [Leptospirales bacterium]
MKRDLVLTTMPELEKELDRLASGPVETAGVWSFAQILEHIAASLEWANGEKSGFLPDGIPMVDPALGKKFFARMVRSGKIPTGVQNDAAPSTRQEGDPLAQMARCKKALARFLGFSGTRPQHPFFGFLDESEWKTWAAMHSSHHLSFADLK